MVVWIHGYSGHVNRPETVRMARIMNEANIGVLCYDIEGHGYSDGERALLLKFEDLIQDAILFVHLLLVEDIEVGRNLHRLTFDDGVSLSQLDAMRQCPFLIMGQSLGGAIASLSSKHFMEPRVERYLGTILLAPYLGSDDLPGKLVLESLRYTVSFRFCD